MKLHKLALFVVLILLAACTGAAPEPSPSLPPTDTPLPPTAAPLPTDTPTPAPTELPGKLVYSLDMMTSGDPWLPFDPESVPTINYYGFNTAELPFNDVLVRKAFAAALDREALFEFSQKYFKNTDFPDSYQPVSSLTPSDVLGRDLYGEVGISYDPAQAKAYLVEAGYEDVSAFPSVEFWVPYAGFVAPGANLLIAQQAAQMWQQNLGITVKVVDYRNYYSNLHEDPPEIFWFGWIADVNDPDNFLNVLFHSRNEFNIGKYSNPQFDRLVEDAGTRILDPASRQILYIQAERILCEEDVALIPLWQSHRPYPQ